MLGLANRIKAGLKANRQNIKLRSHNREMRSQLRGALKAIRAMLHEKDLEGVKNALGKTVSLIDKMASKKIIHSNTAGRYKSRLSTQLANLSSS